MISTIDGNPKYLKIVILLFFSGVFLKFCIFMYLTFPHTYLGVDAEAYHMMAIGEIPVKYNIWPVILKFLNDINLYSRDAIRFVYFLLVALFIPFMAALNMQDIRGQYHKNFFLLSVLFVSSYPSLYYFSWDIYRDIAMIGLFLFAVTCFHSSIVAKKYIIKFILLFFFFLFSFFLIYFRKYLGFSLMMAFVISMMYPYVKKYLSSYALFIGYIGLLVIMYNIHLFEPLLSYRELFTSGESTLYIKLKFLPSIDFLTNYFKSFFIQLFHLYFESKLSIILFFVEGLPFFLSLVYIVVNKRYITIFIVFLISFFVMYATIWTMGNDNMGTAIRLRIFNYMSIYIAAGNIYYHKILLLNNADRNEYRPK